jgi:uncharacterized membrane protein
MKIAHDILGIVILIISALGALVVTWGVIEAIKSFVLIKFKPREKDAVSASEEIRQRLGAHLLLGLEIFIAADIISTVVSPTWEKVGILSVIVIIRTILSYFLRIELKREDQRSNNK